MDNLDHPAFSLALFSEGCTIDHIKMLHSNLSSVLEEIFLSMSMNVNQDGSGDKGKILLPHSRS